MRLFRKIMYLCKWKYSIYFPTIEEITNYSTNTNENEKDIFKFIGCNSILVYSL